MKKPPATTPSGGHKVASVPPRTTTPPLGQKAQSSSSVPPGTKVAPPPPGSKASKGAPSPAAGHKALAGERRREVLQATPMLVVVREYDKEAHEDPSRRGGYLKVVPGKVTEIILDGLASEIEQLDAEKRCRRELQMFQRSQEEFGGDREGGEEAVRRRELVRVTPDVVITRDQDPEAHSDPQRRGAYLMLRRDRLPEIVLDGLATLDEQGVAMERCLRFLELSLATEGPLKRYSEQLRQSEKKIIGGSAAASAMTVPRPRTGTLLGERLVAGGVISAAALAAALARQRQLLAAEPVRRLGSLLVEAKQISLLQLARALGEQRGQRPVMSAVTRVDPHLRDLLPLPALSQAQAAPLFQSGRTLALAMCDPQELELVAELQEQTPLALLPLQAPQVQVYKLLQSLKR